MCLLTFMTGANIGDFNLRRVISLYSPTWHSPLALTFDIPKIKGQSPSVICNVTKN